MSVSLAAPCAAAELRDVIAGRVYACSADAAYAAQVADAILYDCAQYGVDPLLVAALFEQESRFSMDAVSPMGAIGVAQLMPATATGMGINPYELHENIVGGVRYLRAQLDRFADRGEWSATYAIAAYNAGPGAAATSLPPYAETIRHVNRVYDIYMELSQALES